MNEDPAKQRRQIDLQVERWTAEAKKLVEAGKEEQALVLYCRAADELPGAPWLQHRTAELARKLKKADVAIVYFRRAATAFQMADFAKRGIAPLRTAWSLAMEGLPGTSKALVELALELMQLHRRLGFAVDAAVTFERTNAALRNRGFSELAPQASSPPPPGRASEQPSKATGSAHDEGSPSSKSHALAQLFERR